MTPDENLTADLESRDLSAPSTLRLVTRDEDHRVDVNSLMKLEGLERFARENPIAAVGVAAALGFIVGRAGLGGSPIRATGLALGATTDLAGGALRGTTGLAGEALKGTGSLAAGVLGAAVPLASGALGAGAHVGGGVIGATRDVTLGTAKAGFKLTSAIMSLLPAAATLFLLNAYLEGQPRDDQFPA